MNARAAAGLVVASAVGQPHDEARARRLGRAALVEANRIAGDRVLLAAIHVADGAASTGDVERLAAVAAYWSEVGTPAERKPGGGRHGRHGAA